jgi:hypothetical protein
MWYFLNIIANGTPMGRFVKIANALFALTPLNARLCVISCTARKVFWFAVPPITYARIQNFHDQKGVLRR